MVRSSDPLYAWLGVTWHGGIHGTHFSCNRAANVGDKFLLIPGRAFRKQLTRMIAYFIWDITVIVAAMDLADVQNESLSQKLNKNKRL